MAEPEGAADAGAAGFGAGGVDAEVSTTGAFAEVFMSFIVFGTSYTSTSASTLQRTMASRFCFFAFSCARSRATFLTLRAIRESLPQPTAPPGQGGVVVVPVVVAVVDVSVGGVPVGSRRRRRRTRTCRA